jgi:hypothetical protein
MSDRRHLDAARAGQPRLEWPAWLGAATGPVCRADPMAEDKPAGHRHIDAEGA